MRKQPYVVELAGDLQVQRCLSHVCRLHDPVNPGLVVNRVTALDVIQRCLLAERLEFDERGFGSPERIMWPGCDDQRELVPVGLMDREPDDGVTFGLRVLADQGLLQPVGEHDNAAFLEQLPPDFLALGVGQEAGLLVGEELFPRELAEVELVLGVAEPDGR